MLEPSNALLYFCICRATVPGLLNKISCSALTLGVTKLANIRYVILVTLCCAIYVRLRCPTSPPQGASTHVKIMLYSILWAMILEKFVPELNFL